MRLITRADFDGIACGVIITSQLPIDGFVFMEPKSMQDGEIVVTSHDIIANLPFHPTCHLWFDHHFTNQVSDPFRGGFRLAPSAARVVFEYFGEEGLKKYEEMVREADRIDSANLELSDILQPERYVLLSFTIDPTIREDEPYWVELIHLLRDQPFALVMENAEINKRCHQVLNDFALYHSLVAENSRRMRNVVVTDLRKVDFAGKANRFLVYYLFPEANISVRIFKDSHSRKRTGISVGKNIFNNTSPVNVGALLSRFGGGGHIGAGSCRVSDEEAEEVVGEIITALQAASGGKEG
jgi:hypothetical protein